MGSIGSVGLIEWTLRIDWDLSQGHPVISSHHLPQILLVCVDVKGRVGSVSTEQQPFTALIPPEIHNTSTCRQHFWETL